MASHRSNIVRFSVLQITVVAGNVVVVVAVLSCFALLGSFSFVGFFTFLCFFLHHTSVLFVCCTGVAQHVETTYS